MCSFNAAGSCAKRNKKRHTTHTTTAAVIVHHAPPLCKHIISKNRVHFLDLVPPSPPVQTHCPAAIQCSQTVSYSLQVHGEPYSLLACICFVYQPKVLKFLLHWSHTNLWQAILNIITSALDGNITVCVITVLIRIVLSFHTSTKQFRIRYRLYLVAYHTCLTLSSVPAQSLSDGAINPVGVY